LNTAICFLSSGEADAPLELLLHLWQSVEHQHASVEVPVPMALLLSSSSHEMEMSAQLESNQMTRQLLWKLFNASSIAQDWSTCLNCVEELMQGNDCKQQHHSIAHVFALLQCRRSGAAKDTIRSLIPKLSNQEQYLRVVAELYHADALLLNNQNANSNNNFDEEVDPFDCTHRASSALQNCVTAQNSNSESLRELQVTVYNDQGIAHLMKDDSVGALHCFREAAKLIPPSSPLSWLTLPTYFNLSLLLLRDGYAEESAKTWHNARGYFKIWQAAMKGDNESLRELKNLRVVAINRHGLLMAKRSMQGDIWQQENVMEWAPQVAESSEVNEDSTRLGGIDASQVTALDVVLLKYACTSAERKSSSSFRTNVGNIPN